MTETGLVYIYAISPAREPAREYVGCGAPVEGGYVATCRHVWCNATTFENGETSKLPEVEIEFPHSPDEQGVPITSRATLADSCEGLEVPAPDLVLLKPHHIPRNVMLLQLAVREELEVGEGHVHAYLPSREVDDFITGTLTKKNSKKQRIFKGNDSDNYWFEDGSSGSPAFKNEGQQLAGILTRSELGANSGKSHLRQATVVPGTTILTYLERLRNRLVAIDLPSYSTEQQHIRSTRPPEMPLACEGAPEVVVKNMQVKIHKVEIREGLILAGVGTANLRLEQERQALLLTEVLPQREQDATRKRLKLDHE
jgi:hypothetical protein